MAELRKPLAKGLFYLAALESDPHFNLLWGQASLKNGSSDLVPYAHGFGGQHVPKDILPSYDLLCGQIYSRALPKIWRQHLPQRNFKNPAVRHDVPFIGSGYRREHE